MGGVTTPFGVRIDIEDADPLDRLELGDTHCASLIIVAKTKQGTKRISVVLSPENVEQLQFKLADWIG